MLISEKFIVENITNNEDVLLNKKYIILKLKLFNMQKKVIKSRVFCYIL